MERIPAVLLLAVALYAVGICCAPIATPLPSSVSTPVPVNEGGKESGSSLANVEDVMMDPSAKLPWQKQEGDITYLTDKFLWPEDPDDPFFELPAAAGEQRSKRAAVKNRYRRWTNGVVPYIISDAYTESEVKTIIQAMDHWEARTCIRFVPRTTELDYVGIFPGGGCYSYVGRIGGYQGISVGRRCFAFYTTLHEIGHALGFYHEQMRPDRDEHIQIISDKIVAGAESEFEKLSDSLVDSLGVGYDYNSIMHYDANLYSRDGSPTIIALDPDIPIGKARGLSDLDVEQTNRLYNCPTVPPPRSTIAPVDEDGPTFPTELPYPDCGGFITDLHGTIQSPGYPEYTHNANCAWLFKMPRTGYNILFSFRPFQVETSPDCESDYVQLYESLDTSGYTDGRKCGNYRFYPMNSFTSYARLEFHTNGSNETPNLKGFELKYEVADIDECHPHWKVCSHECRNFEGGFECSCPEGFFMSIDGKNCFDINECGLDKGGCDHKCINRAGYYHCACEEGYTLQSDNKTCLADGAGDPCIEANCEQGCQLVNNVAQCQCPTGYQLDTDGRSCIDTNECLNQNGYCQHICNNKVGHYTCSCNPGYDLMPDGFSCLPSNPCPVNNGGCDHICTFTGVSRVCSCRSGYELASNGTSCNVINPCAVNNGGCQQLCTVSGDSRVCSCESGFQLSSNGTMCADINECASNGGKGDCEHACMNTVGSRVCTCPTGYQLLADGVSCEDIDECKTNNGSCGRLHCINQEGSHQCGCKEGFKLRDDGNGCAEILQGASGKISSGNWPETYPVNVDLQWVIQCESHQAVDLTFSNGFGIAGSLPSCEKDWLMVFDGDSMSSEVMGKFCHYAVPQVSRSSSSNVLIYFFAGPNHSPSRKGFEVSYTCMDVAVPATTSTAAATTAAPTVKQELPTIEVTSKPEATLPPTTTLPPQPTQCGQTLFTGNSGTIESPNWPYTYPTNIQCEYFIQLPDEGSRVEISFSGFRIAGQYPDCDKDWVKVYDGHTNDGHVHGTYCHTSLPATITTSGSKAKIVLYAGPSHNPSRNGFSASYRTITS